MSVFRPSLVDSGFERCLLNPIITINNLAANVKN